VFDSFLTQRMRMICLTTTKWSIIRGHRRCPVPWVASGIEAGTSRGGRAQRRLRMTILRAPYTGYYCVPLCPHLHPRGSPRVILHSNLGVRTWEQLLHVSTVLCIGIEPIAITRIEQHVGCVFGGFESATIEPRPRWVILPRQSPSLNS
jgi:hypothetical protein